MIAPSEKTKNLLEEYGITCPIYVVPSGIELSEYAGDKEAACRERIRAEFSVFFRNDASSVCGKAGKRETHRGASAFPETGPGKADGAADCRRRSAPERTYGEALASGLPLLCRKDDCLKGILREGENGWQYESAGEFQRFLADWMALPGAEKEKMRQSARQSAEVFFRGKLCQEGGSGL